jgi:hypothetical protein
LGEHVTKCGELVIDLDAQGLEGLLVELLCVGMEAVWGVGGGESIKEVLDGVEGGGSPLLKDGMSEAVRVRKFAVGGEDGGEPFEGIGVEDVGGGELGGAVHAHVEGLIVEAEGEAAVWFVEVVRGDAEVGKDAVDGGLVVEEEEVGEEAEVGIDEGEAGVVECVGHGVVVMVEGEELTVAPKLVEDKGGVSTGAEGEVYVDAVGSDVESLHGLLEEYGEVVRGGEVFHGGKGKGYFE